MTDRPLVSVITGTWQRHDLLAEAIENVREQTYRPLEHVIVSDGPDDELCRLIDREQLADVIEESGVPIRLVELGRNWSTFLQFSISAVPFQVAQWMARGEYLCWLADDERMAPDHIASLVDLLETTDSDFVYSKSRLWFNPALGPQYAGHEPIIGEDPPRCGTVTNVLYRAELLDYRGFEIHVGSGTDWDQVDHWMRAGARWAMLDRVTHSHRVDKIGEGTDVRMQRQPLRGHQR